MRDFFSEYHPMTLLLFYLSVLIFSIFIMHPLFIAVSFISALLYSFIFKRADKNVFFMLIFFLVAGLINPLLNHKGDTPILYINSVPITLEALIYGVFTSVMFFTVTIWFLCFNKVFDSKKISYLLSRISNKVALIFTMVIIFSKNISKLIKSRQQAQKGIGVKVKNSSLRVRIKYGMLIIMSSASFVLESCVITANSLKEKGYNSKEKSIYHRYKFKTSDTVLVITIVFIDILLCIGMINKAYDITFYNSISFNLDERVYIFGTFYALLCLIPIVANCSEEIRWHFVRSKI